MENPATPRGECDAIFSGSAPSATRESASSREPRRYCQAPVPHSPSPPPQREALGVSESVRANTRLGPVGKGGPGPLRCCRWWGGTGEDLRGGLALCSTLCCLTLGPKGLLKSPALPATPIRRRPRPTATRRPVREAPLQQCTGGPNHFSESLMLTLLIPGDRDGAVHGRLCWDVYSSSSWFTEAQRGHPQGEARPGPLRGRVRARGSGPGP